MRTGEAKHRTKPNHITFGLIHHGFSRMRRINTDNPPISVASVKIRGEFTRFLTDYVPPPTEPESRAEHLRAISGISKQGFEYKSTLPVLPNNIYVLRSINFNRSDVLVAFRVVRVEKDASIVLLWKVLKRFSTPTFADRR